MNVFDKKVKTHFFDIIFISSFLFFLWIYGFAKHYGINLPFDSHWFDDLYFSNFFLAIVCILLCEARLFRSIIKQNKQDK